MIYIITPRHSSFLGCIKKFELNKKHCKHITCYDDIKNCTILEDDHILRYYKFYEMPDYFDINNHIRKQGWKK
jgi:hypothetical protein